MLYSPPRITVVVFGVRFRSLLIVSEIYFFVWASKNLPSVIRVKIEDAVTAGEVMLGKLEEAWKGLHTEEKSL